VDVSKFVQNIVYAQDVHIRPLIGEDCYKTLLEQFSTNTLSSTMAILLGGNDANFRGLKPALAYWVLYESYLNLHSTITPTGVHVKNPDDNLSVTFAELAARKNEAKVRAEYYSNQVICYLQENISSYPCFTDSENCCTRMDYEGYKDSGIVLDDDFTDPKTEEDLKKYKGTFIRKL